jgi:hypothetical protein
MALHIVTGTGALNLNDLTNYVFVDLDLGHPVRGESWILPKVKGAQGLLANFWDQPVQMTLVVGVKGTTVANLVANSEALRNEFTDANNTIAWSIDDASQSVKTIVTYPSPIPPFLNGTTPQQIYLAANSKVAIRWELPIWRQPYYSGDTRVPVG